MIRNKNLFFLILIIIILGLFFYFNQSSDFLTYQSCEELEILMTKESENIDFSCATSKECVYTDALICGGCINKDADTAKYEKIQKVIHDKGCPVPLPSCLLVEDCECIDHMCVPLYK